MNWEDAAQTDRGRHRAGNEDAFLLRPDAGLFIVADGMGGHAAGEVASHMAVEIASERFLEAAPPAGAPIQVARALAAAVRAANRGIFERSEREPDKKGMGTTITALVLVEDGTGYVLAQVGDSRAYGLREGRLRQLTTDHTWVQEQIALGHLTRGQARVHPFSNIVTRALGTEPTVKADIRRGRCQPGDRLLLCSDGLTAMLGDRAIRDILLAEPAPAAAAAALIAAANDRGGHDNITVVVLAAESPPR